MVVAWQATVDLETLAALVACCSSEPWLEPAVQVDARSIGPVATGAAAATAVSARVGVQGRGRRVQSVAVHLYQSHK